MIGRPASHDSVLCALSPLLRPRPRRSSAVPPAARRECPVRADADGRYARRAAFAPAPGTAPWPIAARYRPCAYRLHAFDRANQIQLPTFVGTSHESDHSSERLHATELAPHDARARARWLAAKSGARSFAASKNSARIERMKRPRGLRNPLI